MSILICNYNLFLVSKKKESVNLLVIYEQK